MRIGGLSQVDAVGGALLALLICFAVINAAIGIPLSLYYAVFGLFCLNAIISMAYRGESNYALVYALIWILAYLWLATATAIAGVEYDSKVFMLAGSTFMLAILSAFRRGDRFYRTFIVIVVTFSVLFSLVLIAAHFEGRGDFRRTLRGGYLSFGMLLSVAAAIMAPYLVATRGKIRIIMYAAVAPIYLGLIVSQARGALLFTAALTVLIFILYWPRREGKRKARTGFVWRAILFGGAAALVVYFVPARTVYRLERMFFREGGEENRWNIWATSWDAFTQSPLLGHGVGYSFSFDFAHPHNLFLQFGVDSGLPGVLLLLIIVLFPIVAFFRHGSGGIRTYPPLLVGLFAAYLVMLMEHSKSGDIYAGRSIFILAGLVLGTALRKPQGVAPKARARPARMIQPRSAPA